MTHRDERRFSAGFTLLEALIATAMMAMVLVALSTITAQWLPNWNRGIARVQRDEDLALGLDRLVGDLTAAEFVGVDAESPKPFFNGTGNSVTFVRTNLSPNARPGLEFVRFAEVSTAQGPALVRSQAPFVFASDTSKGRQKPQFTNPIALIRTPYLVSLVYAGADRIWRDTWQQEMLLPRAVRLTVRDATSRRALSASTATLLHVEIPADCIASKSLADCINLLKSPKGQVDATTSSASARP